MHMARKLVRNIEQGISQAHSEDFLPKSILRCPLSSVLMHTYVFDSIYYQDTTEEQDTSTPGSFRLLFRHLLDAQTLHLDGCGTLDRLNRLGFRQFAQKIWPRQF